MIKKCFQQLFGKHRTAQQFSQIQASRGTTPDRQRRTCAYPDWMATKYAAATVAGKSAAPVTRKPTATAIATRSAIATSPPISTVAEKGATALATPSTGPTRATIPRSKGSAPSRQEQTSRQDSRGEQDAEPPLDVVIHEDLRSLIL
jgi:hypothetical protein